MTITLKPIYSNKNKQLLRQKNYFTQTTINTIAQKPKKNFKENNYLTRTVKHRQKKAAKLSCCFDILT
jgi:hypothetical protein